MVVRRLLLWNIGISKVANTNEHYADFWTLGQGSGSVNGFGRFSQQAPHHNCAVKNVTDDAVTLSQHTCTPVSTVQAQVLLGGGPGIQI